MTAEASSASNPLVLKMTSAPIKDVGRDESGERSKGALVRDLKVLVPIFVISIPLAIVATLYWDALQQFMTIVAGVVIAAVLVFFAFIGLRQFFSGYKSLR